MPSTTPPNLLLSYYNFKWVLLYLNEFTPKKYRELDKKPEQQS